MYQKVKRQVKMYCNLVHCLYIFNAYERKHSGHLKCTLTLTCSLYYSYNVCNCYSNSLQTTETENQWGCHVIS